MGNWRILERMRPHSYASDAGAGDKREWTWLLFVRQKSSDVFAFVVVAQRSDRDSEEDVGDEETQKRALYELQLDAEGLREHVSVLLCIRQVSTAERCARS